MVEEKPRNKMYRSVDKNGKVKYIPFETLHDKQQREIRDSDVRELINTLSSWLTQANEDIETLQARVDILEQK